VYRKARPVHRKFENIGCRIICSTELVTSVTLLIEDETGNYFHYTVRAVLTFERARIPLRSLCIYARITCTVHYAVENYIFELTSCLMLTWEVHTVCCRCFALPRITAMLVIR
jgi:hypothetical protein